MSKPPKRPLKFLRWFCREDYLEEVFKSHHPAYTLDYRFLSEEYDALYQAENRVGTLSTYFSSLAILISCLGLATFMAENRAKEIGICKPCGAATG
ncbi:MAG: hypothetical protein AAF824_17585 [Bacteroidota bacterium]